MSGDSFGKFLILKGVKSFLMGNYDNKNEKLIKYKVIDEKKFNAFFKELGERIYHEKNPESYADITLETVYDVLSEKMGYEKESLKKYYTSRHFSSECLNKLLEVSKETNLENIGLTTIDETEMKKAFAERFRECLSSWKGQNEFAKMIGSGTPAVSKWCSGENFPEISNLTMISVLLGVSTDYLLGITDTKELDIDFLKKKTGLSEEMIKSMSYYNNEKNKNNKEVEEIKNDLGFSYADVADYIIQDKQLIDVFYMETFKTLQFYCDPICQEKYDEIINRKNDLVVDKSVCTGKADLNFGKNDILLQDYEITIETIAKALLHKKIDILFDDFVDNIIFKNIISGNFKGIILEEYFHTQERKLDTEIKRLEYLKNEKSKINSSKKN